MLAIMICHALFGKKHVVFSRKVMLMFLYISIGVKADLLKLTFYVSVFIIKIIVLGKESWHEIKKFYLNQ